MYQPSDRRAVALDDRPQPGADVVERVVPGDLLERPVGASGAAGA